MRSQILIILIVLSSLNTLYAVPLQKIESVKRVLTLEECISRALEENYSVVISGNNLDITRNNVTMAPFLPTVSLSSRYSDTRSEQRNYNTDDDVVNSSLKSTSVVNGANFNWRLFDGFAMFATREKQLELLLSLIHI